MAAWKVYVSGPYTAGDQMGNIRDAVLMGNHLAGLGFVPFIPHLTGFWHLLQPHSHEFWLDQDMEWLTVCNAVLRLPGVSPGADAEVQLARSLHIPVYFSAEALIKEMGQ